MSSKKLIITFSFFISFAINSQTSKTLLGKIISGVEPAISVNVIIDNTTKGTFTDFDGNFVLKNISKEKFKLVLSGIGYETKYINVDFAGKPEISLSINLNKSTENLEEVVIQSKTESEKIKAKGFAVNTITTEVYLNMPTDINAIISTSSGVNLRESGGLGSNFDIAVNGLSGNYIKYFIDGVAMENWGSALSLNNFPANLIERINIYKGVVPVKIGSDALGGAIDISTVPIDEKKIDVSYSIGSFNTHRVGFSGQTHTKNDIVFRLNSYYNYSDNNYKMKNVLDTDEFGNIIGTTEAERFNDKYESIKLTGKVGVINKFYADELTFNYVYANNTNNIQHPEVSINEIYGGLHTKNKARLGYFKYKKSLDKLKINSYYLLGKIKAITIDTLSRNYNWQGGYTEQTEGTGEYFGLKSIYNLNDDISSSSTTLEYKFNNNNITTLNTSTNSLKRVGDDEINPNNNSFENPNSVGKTVYGLSHETKSLAENLRITGLLKHYRYNSTISQEGFDGGFVLQEQEESTKFNVSGYGFTSSYKVSNKLLAKLSYERAYRLPEANEILGDGVFIRSNIDLKQEESDNINFELHFTSNNNSSKFSNEANLFYRNSKNFIRERSQGILTFYENDANVRVLGIENFTTLKLNNKFNLSLAVTYQSLTDQTEFDEGLINTNYQSRLPNVPYFFGNFRAGVNLLTKNESKSLKVWLTNVYTHKFFLYWESLGDLETKNEIPSQFTSDIDITYSLKDKYNVSASVKNILDAENYDNFNIQNPGRAFYLTLRYFINY